MKKSVLAIMVGALCIILSSCQETPEESSVVSKVDGISEAAVCEPLKKGEKRETNVPTHWKFEEKKSNDRVVIQADIKLGEQSIGNLPVIEMQNHELTQEELNGLIDYFTDGEELYMPQMVTKDAYQEVLDRISSKEGSYLQSAYSTSIAGIQNATREGMELAPDEASAPEAASLWPEKMDPSFQGSRPECFKIWVIRNLRFPADRYDVGDEAKVEVVFAIDKNGTLTDLKVTHCEERHFADRLCKTIALSPKWSPGRTKGKPVKTELEMRFVFRLVAPPAGQEELGLCAEECDIHTTADRMPLFCGAVRTGFVRGCSGRSTA